MNQNHYLWQNFLQGDKEALSGIFLNFHDDLFRYGFKLSGNENLVKDAIQDLFLKLWKNRSNLKPVENSSYVDFDLELPEIHDVKIAYLQ